MVAGVVVVVGRNFDASMRGMQLVPILSTLRLTLSSLAKHVGKP